MGAAGASRELNYASQTAALVQTEGWERGSRRGKSTAGLSPCFYPFLQDHVFIRDEVGHRDRRPEVRPTQSVQNQALHYRNRERFATIKSASLVSSHPTPPPLIPSPSAKGSGIFFFFSSPNFSVVVVVGIATRYCTERYFSSVCVWDVKCRICLISLCISSICEISHFPGWS